MPAETMDADDYDRAYLAAFRAAGHEPILHDDGNVDWFVTSPNGHNGPGCKRCGFTECYHCRASLPAGETIATRLRAIPKCDGGPS